MCPTGPITPEGKAVVSRNAIQHGLYARAIVATANEDSEEWIAFHNAAVADLAPAGTVETDLASRAAALLWHLRRLPGAEAEMINRRSVSYASLERVARVEAHLGRQLQATLHELEAMQERRRGRRAPLARLDIATPFGDRDQQSAYIARAIDAIERAEANSRFTRYDGRGHEEADMTFPESDETNESLLRALARRGVDETTWALERELEEDVGGDEPEFKPVSF
jgi:hypothetical protein